MANTKQQCERAPTDEIPFPNRQLGYERARTGLDYQYHSDAWGNVALSNLKANDTFLLGRDERMTVVSISTKTLKYMDGKGAAHTLRADSDKMFKFANRLGDRLALECVTQNNRFHTEKESELTAIFMRDLAASRDEQGVYILTH